MKKLGALFFCLVFLVQPLQAAEIKLNPQQEARAKVINQQLRCLVCQGEDIEQSNADFAKDVRQLVREKIRQGKGDEDIIAFLRARYGDFILMSPPLAPYTYMLWAAPFVVMLGGLWLVLRPRRKKNKK